jgi:hypothetical protein
MMVTVTHSHRNRSKILNIKLQTHFLRSYVWYRTKSNTALESKAAFVHLNCIATPLRVVAEHAIRVNKSFTFLSRSVNNY